MMLSPELTFLLAIAVFWIVLYALSRVVHLEEHGLDVKPFYFMYKSKALNRILDVWAKKRRKLWLVLSNISIAFGIGLMVFGVYFLVDNLLRFIYPIGVASPIFPVVPVLTIRLYWLPYFFVAVVVIMLTHELAHGIIARLEEIPVLSTGVLAAVIFFGAFVEPDEKEFEKASVLSRLRMLAVGSSANLVTALLALVLLGGLFAPPAGILIYEVAPDGPLARSGVAVQRWDVIQAINGTDTTTYEQFSDYMRGVGPNVTLTLTVLLANQRENITIATAPSPTNSSKGLIGFEVGFIPVYNPSRLGLNQYASIHLSWTLFWIYLLGLSVAIFNMFPLYPFDGERFLYYPLEKLMGKQKLNLRKTMNIIFLGLLAGNMILSFVRFGLLPI